MDGSKHALEFHAFARSGLGTIEYAKTHTIKWRLRPQLSFVQTSSTRGLFVGLKG